jgi:hypothetical protein
VARFPARGALALLGLVVAAGLEIAAEPLTLRELRTGASVVPASAVTAGAHHGYALLVLGVALLVLGAAAVVRRSVPAAAAALVVALCAAFVVAAIDRPVLDDTGLVGARRVLARAHAGPAWRLEVAGAVLALASAGGALALAVAPEGAAGAGAAAGGRRRRSRYRR